MVEALEQVDDGLEYYWDHLSEISGGNQAMVHQEL